MKLYRIRTVAEKLNKHEITIRRWIAEGRLKYVRIDQRHIRVPEEELNRLIEEAK